MITRFCFKGNLMDKIVEKKVIDILAQQTLVEAKDIGLNSTPEDLGLDSLGVVEVIFALEEEFDISIPFNANDSSQNIDITNVSSIIAAVKKFISSNES
tara:strand:- start:38 stop:334 length:297 start_codon:yes stop_codon:yes gene_type:complete